MISGQRVGHLKSVYGAIAARMKALPISHPALSVEAVGFVDCDDGQLGVIVTPWCMNLVFLPPEGTCAQGERTLGLPAGPVTLAWQHLEDFGALASKSLFSPMSAFADQALAVETAQQLMRTLLTPGRSEPVEDGPTAENTVHSARPGPSHRTRRELFALFRKRP